MMSGGRAGTVENLKVSCLQVPAIDSSSDDGIKPNKIVGNIEFRDAVFHYPARTEVTVSGFRSRVSSRDNFKVDVKFARIVLLRLPNDIVIDLVVLYHKTQLRDGFFNQHSPHNVMFTTLSDVFGQNCTVFSSCNL